SSLKVIALISGGKDSLFSILHCRANGHEVVALGNLHPAAAVNGGNADTTTDADADADAEGEDLDSYMYQTVGHTVIPLYASALNLPLYRQPILGSAVNTDREYAVDAASAAPDETESLFLLLLRIKQEHPAANAVSTGAILSTYQRTRVESVALRLGLTPLSYLWQYPYLPPYTESSLLHDMAAVGQDSRIIKVASGGLDEGFLWENVADQKTVRRLRKAAGRFGGEGAVLGEGGEFETLAVDGPGALWKRRIEVDVGERVMGEGGSAVQRFKGARAVDKEEGDDGVESLRRPDLLDDEFSELLQVLRDGQNHPSVFPDEFSSGPGIQSIETQTLSTSTTLTILNLTAPDLPTASAQLSSILTCLQTTHNIDPSTIVHTTLLLRSMADFTTLNPIYGAFFTSPNPPARVTIACGSSLPANIHVMLSATVDLGPRDQRRGLHVQSRSYWAPANIGPYSQAITVPAPSFNTDEDDDNAIIHIAGQIPLEPATMDLILPQHPALSKLSAPVPDAFALQTVLALQHLWRIGRAMSVSSWGYGMAFIDSPSSDEVETERDGDGNGDAAAHRAATAIAAWNGIHDLLLRRLKPDGGEDADDDDDEQDNDVDVWHLKYGGAAYGAAPLAPEQDTRPLLPAAYETGRVPPVFVAQVDELPRGAGIEWVGMGVKGG
ncbi:adenine nucleotide alpha hydrolases-like protein, partial [Saccharata proteae CBS 121410]